MMYYRSDWPEVGFDAPLSFEGITAPEEGGYHEIKSSGAILRWITSQNKFESDFYEFPIWDICLMVTDPYGDLLDEFRENTSLYAIVYKETARMMDTPPWKSAYISAKLVRGEPLYEALIKLDFTEMEHRRLYTCKIGDLKGTPISQFDDNIRFCLLTDLPAKKLSYYQDQIVELCREGFHSGYTRHFTDEFLFKNKSGVEYISAAMELNFEFADHRHFLIALDEYEYRICGFTVIGSKSWLGENIHTQLLSAVSKAYRGKGIYRGLTDLLSKTFPPDTKLLNVTHVENQKIQRAYQDSGRTHVADTVVLRRIFI